jgi:hypothetical protein
MDDGHELAVGAAQAAQCRRLSWSEGGDDDANAIDSGIPIRRVRRDEFIWAAFPADAGLKDEVQESKLVIFKPVS